MKLEERLSNISEQIADLSSAVQTRTDELVGDRTRYERELVSDIFKETLTKEQYTALETLIRTNIENEGKEYEDQVHRSDLEKEYATLKDADMFAPLDDLSKEKRLLAAEYLTDLGLITGGCHGDLGWFKDPSSCGGCVGSQRTFDRLGLREFLHYRGERCYGLEEELLDEALAQAMAEDDRTLGAKLADLRKDKELLASLEATKKTLLKKQVSYAALENAGVDAETIDEIMPEAVEYVKQVQSLGKTTVSDIKVDLESKTLAVLTDEWYYSGSGGCEYSAMLYVFRGDAKTSKMYVYRDAYSSARDNWLLAFKTIVDLVVEDDTVKATLKSNSWIEEEELNIPYKESTQEALSEEEQQAFMDAYQQQKQELLQRHTRDSATMPGYVPLSALPQAGNMDVPYKRAETIDEFVDERHGEARIVIKSQIDHHAGRGMQFEWVKYRVTESGTDLLERECAYESELKHGREIRMHA